MPPTPPDPLRALGGTRTRGHLDETGEGRPTRTLGRWREVAAGLSGLSVLALGGLGALAAAHYTRRVPDRDRVTVAWTERASLLGHPAALMGAAAATAAGDFEVVLKREGVSKDDDAASLVHAPRVLFVRLGERFSAGDRVFIRKFFDRRRSSRCLVVIMLNANDLSNATELNSQGPCEFGPNLSAQNYVSGYTEKHTRTSTVSIECAFAFFTEDTLHPFDRGSDPNKRAVDAIAAFIRRPRVEPRSRFGRGGGCAKHQRSVRDLKVDDSQKKVGGSLGNETKYTHTQRAMAQKSAALRCTDRAYAHYRRARMHANDRRLAHLRRGDRYARMAAFGIDHAQHPVSTLMVGFDPNDPGEDEAHPADMPLAWTPTTGAQAFAVDALLMAELNGDSGAVGYGGGSDLWAACRDDLTGGVYIAKCAPGRPEDPRPKVRSALEQHATPREALAVLRSVEDWRESMLMVKTPSGGWAYATRPQMFAYYDFMLNTKDAGATATYANAAYRDWCVEQHKSSSAKNCRDIIIPDSYFPSVGFLSSFFSGSQRAHFMLKRDDNRPSTIYTRDSDRWLEMRPTSLVHDAPIKAGMPRHLARLILGIVEESPDETWVRTKVERFVRAINLDAGFDASRCRSVQNAANSLYPNSTFECDEDTIRRQQAKLKREEFERSQVAAGLRKREQDASSRARETEDPAPTLATPRVKDVDWAYRLLEIPRGSPASDVKKAYGQKALKYHPDKGASPEDFKLIKEARDLISRVSFSGNLFGLRRRANRHARA